jgi:collagen triple helix repeat protein
MADAGSGNSGSSGATALQLIGQAIAAVVAVLGATGYIIALGAVVLWARLGQAGFPREPALSTASRQELLVLGAEALAVWVALALVLLLLAARLLNTPGMRTQDVVADLIWGLLVSLGTLAAIDSDSLTLTVLIAAALALGVCRVVANAVWLRPPLPVWATPLLSASIGAALPFIVRGLGGEGSPTITVLAAWAAFILVLLLLRQLMAMRERLLATEAAAAQLGTDGREPPPELATDAQLGQALRQRVHALRRGFWTRAVGICLLALLLLGGIAVASQFDKKRLFRSALVSLNTGRCVLGTYVTRGDGRVVLGDQVRHGTSPNKVVVIPDSEILELQVRNPTAVGVQLARVDCKSGKAVITPDGSAAEPFRGPRGPRGFTGATGGRGPTGKTGQRGETGPVGQRGARGEMGPVGQRGARGPRGRRGPAGVTGNG